MKISYNYEKIHKTIKNLSALTDIPISFVSLDDCKNFDSRLTLPPNKQSDFCLYIQSDLKMRLKCINCDKMLLNKNEYNSHICHTGLYDATFPIFVNNIIVGYLLFGCLRCSRSPKEPYNITDEKAIKLYKKRPFFTDEQIESLKNLLPDILLNDAIIIEYSDIINEISDYIQNNLQMVLTVEHLCKKFHISKSTLYKLFEEHFSTTPNSYILSKRLEKAKELIPDKSLTISEAAAKSGFAGYHHFCRAFKKHTGLSPSEFRKAYR